MTLPGEQIDCLTRLPVLIEGNWEQSSARWKGAARTSEPIVSVVFLTAGGKTEWCKSERGQSEALDLAVNLGPFDEFGPKLVQVIVIAGGASRQSATRVASPESRPVLPSQVRVTTGRIIELLSMEGEPQLSASILLLASQDVAMGRRGLWHVRDPLAERIDEPLRTILTKGRTGQFPAA